MQVTRNACRPGRLSSLSRLAATIASLVVSTTILGAVLAAFDSLADAAVVSAMAPGSASRQA
ncbi:MAG: hypothetical protein KIT17_09765 [Rubrivivax sp.]|nr:hypothetical protein [Rubrivivax sp.]